MHYNDITKKAIDEALITTEGKTPERTMYVTLMQESKTPNPAVEMHKDGIFSLSANYDPKRQQDDEERQYEIDDQTEDLSKNTSYIGKTGEYRVASELLLRGYNANIAAVDDGIDVVATKGQHMVYIQVKTSNNKNDRYIADLNTKSFKKNLSENVYYIFVLLDKTNISFLVMPYHEISKQIDQGHLSVINNGKRYRAVITLRDNKVYLGKMGNDVTYYLNSWNIITQSS